jgi:hypothetical protein
MYHIPGLSESPCHRVTRGSFQNIATHPEKLQHSVWLDARQRRLRGAQSQRRLLVERADSRVEP